MTDDTDLPDDDLPTITGPIEADGAVDVDRLIEESGLAAGFDAAALGKEYRLNDRQLKFAMAILQGRNQTEAATVAGFKGNGATIRSAGSKCANSKKVRKFLEAARTVQAAKPVADMTNEEKRGVLSRIARESSDAVRVRAILGHSQLEREDRERQGEFNDDPVATLVEIADLDDDCFVIALGLARKHNLSDQFETAWEKYNTLQRTAPGLPNSTAVVLV